MTGFQLDDIQFWRLANPDFFSEQILYTHHNHWICFGAVLLGILTAGALLPITDRYNQSQGSPRAVWLLAGSIAMGLGIWAMHFTAMLAFHVDGVDVDYNIPITILSVIPAIFASACCIALTKISKDSLLYLNINALIMALGIGGMHYFGMEAITSEAKMYYIPKYFILSIIAAYLLALFGLYTHINLSDNTFFTGASKIIFSSIILGSSISTMHFIAMQATYFIAPITNLAEHAHSTPTGLFITIGIITVGLMCIIIFGSYIDRKMSAMAYSLKESEERFQRLAETTQTAIFTFNDKYITYANPALKEILGYDNKDFLSKSIKEVFGDEFQQFSEKVFATDNTLGNPVHEELKVIKADGSSCWLYISLTLARIDHGLTGLASACDISQQKIAELNMRELAYTDILTKLPNRRKFIETLNQHLSSLTNNDILSCVILLDMDNFKSFNDNNGHLYGDKLLVEIAKRLKQLEPNNSMVARLGGDEFIILIKDLSEMDGCTAISQIIQEHLSRPYFINERVVQLNCSMGVLELNPEYRTFDYVLRDVDAALYRAKQDKNSRWVLFDDNLDASTKRKRQLLPELKKAIHDNQLQLHYQPIVDAKNYKTMGFEALSRWQKDDGEWVSPAEFIPLAENNGLIDDLALWCLESACKQIHKWNQSNVINDFYISVNISSASIKDDRFYTKISDVFKLYEVKQGQLKLELTERMLMNNSDEFINKLNKIIDLGCELMIDDFGTGYSSLSYLHLLTTSTLKIDRSFILNMESNENAEPIVKTIIALAKSLNMSIISEGIENLSQAEKLHSMGSDLLQGFYFCKPLPIEKITDYINQNSNHNNDAVLEKSAELV